jgi:hypothetical protein
LTETLVVHVTGETSRDAPMTWGQLTQQAIFDFVADEGHRLTIHREVGVPLRANLDHVSWAVAALVSRHEVLRTNFSSDRRQWIRGDARFEIPVMLSPSDEELDERRQAMREEVVRHTESFPVQFHIRTWTAHHSADLGPDADTAAEVGATIEFVASHLAVDAYAADLLADDLRHLLGMDGLEAERLPARPQPADRAADEATDARRRLSERNIKRWQRFLEAGRVSIPAPTLGGQTPRFWTATFESPTLQAALSAAANRLKVFPAAVLLAGLGATLGEAFALRDVAVRFAFSNRVSDRDESVETLMQWGLTVLDTSASSEQLVGAAANETFQAASTANYDIYRLFDVMRRDGEPDNRRSMLAESTFYGEPSHHNDSDGLYFVFAFPGAETISLHFLIDTRLMSLADLEASARSIETWVVAVAR